MVAGHLQEKKGYFYVVLNYKDGTGKRKSKWIPTQLPVKGNKKKAEKLLMEHRRLFVPDDQPLTDDILFSDFMIQWLEIIRPTVAIATYAGYHSVHFRYHFSLSKSRQHSVKKIVYFVRKFRQTSLDLTFAFIMTVAEVLVL